MAKLAQRQGFVQARGAASIAQLATVESPKHARSGHMCATQDLRSAAEESKQSDEDQVNRHDVIQQLGKDQNQDSRHKRDNR